MEATWNAANASRDSDHLFKSAADDIDRFNAMLNSDGRALGLYSLRRSIAFSAVIHTTPSVACDEYVSPACKTHAEPLHSVQCSCSHDIKFGLQ